VTNLYSRSKSRKKKNNRIVLVILLSCLIGIGGLAIWGFIYKNDSKEFKKVVTNFIKIIETKDYDKFAGVLEENSFLTKDYTLIEVKEKYEKIFDGLDITDIRASNINIEKINSKEQALTYQLEMTTPLGKIKNLKYHAKLIKQKGHYSVIWDPSLVFPGMEGKDKVVFRNWKAERGEIKDHLGNGLAINKHFDWAGIIPKDLEQGGEKARKLEEISHQFDIPVDEIKQKLDQKWVKDDLFVPIKIIDSNQESAIPGITYQDVKLRYYPLKEAAAHMIGYIGEATKEDLDKHPNLNEGDTVGKVGLEKTFDKKLRGTNGGEIFIVDEKGKKKKELQKREKIDGEELQLTIDAYIQKEAYRNLNGKPGSTVVMNPKEGGLYALVSSPSFDPNKMARGISQKEYDEYANEKNKPFISRYAVGYAPGSTFKALTASIGLDANVTYPEKQRKINGLSWQKDKTWGGYSVTRVSDIENVDMGKALVYSDNIYFAQETLEMGEEILRNGLNKFIFEEDLDLPISMNRAQISNEPKFNSDIMLADTGYGQGELLISPIQQIAMYSVFQNEGKIVYPKLLLAENKRKTKRAISAAAANQLKKDLRMVVNDPNGTAHLLYNSKHDLAAKTGTAELKKKQGEKGNENSFLLAFDARKDHFIILSLVENYTNGSSATQLNKPFIEDLYNYIEHR